MDYKEATLTDGQVVKVYRPPTFRIRGMVEKKYPRPEAPIVTETTAAGKEIQMEIGDDPQYLRDLAEWERLTAQETEELQWLFVFRDETPPEDWDAEAEVGMLVRLADPDWQPRQGPMGRKLDYIEWTLVGDITNARIVQSALVDMLGLDLAEVERNEDSFRDQVEGAPAQ